MIPGRATPASTAAFAARFPDQSRCEFFRGAQGLTLSTLGLGSYLGKMDPETDDAYTAATMAAVRAGINVIDTSLNYRHQHSERAIGKAISNLISDNACRRDELLICTKAGYLVPDAQPFLHFYEVVGGMHCMTPGFLNDQLERSRANLGLETIDVFYLHNPETQLGPLPRELFDQRIRTAFEAMETMVASGRIGFYGTATWEGYRKPAGAGLSLPRMVELATEVAGEDHHFRFVQMPYNLAMHEASTLSNQPVNGSNVPLLQAARSLGITVIGSASLLQSRLLKNLPEELAARFPGAKTNAQRALQFARSAPGLTVSLAGMSRVEHVQDNVAVGRIPPIDPAQYAKFFQSE